MSARTRVALSLALLLAACRTPPGDRPADREQRAGGETAVSAGAATRWFVEAARASGIDFVHFNGMSGRMYLAEIMGSGAALFDYDNDGDLDLFVTQGQMLGADRSLRDAVFPLADPAALHDRLFRNDLVVNADGSRTLHFTDVTAASGLDSRGYAMGVATGDVDNDGWVDLLVTRLGTTALWHNNGNGTFTDVTARTGAAVPGWSVSAAFFDYDRDGWLDLYIGNYLAYSVGGDATCYSRAGARDYCAPAQYRPAVSRLLHNRGNGTFADVTAAAGLADRTGPTLGVIAFDADGDGWPDLFVANDAAPNHLWMNQHDGRFREAALAAGVAVSGDGRPEGSMGVDAADVDDDGDDDLLVTNIAGEGHDLYVNDGRGVFQDRSTAAGLTASTIGHTGFGAAWLDVDNDGWLDLFAVNGAIHTIEAQVRGGDRYPLHERKQLLRNSGDGRFVDATTTAGPALAVESVGRGAAVGDIDNDGDLDVVVINNSGPLELLVNQIGARSHWVGLRVMDRHGRDAIGAGIEVTTAAGRHLRRRVHTDGSYASASDPRVVIGVGQETATVRVRATWPGAGSEEWRDVPIDRYTTLRQGS